MRSSAGGWDRLVPTASARVLQSEQAAWPQARGVGRGLVAVRGEGVVQFWLRPGEQAVFFDLSHDPPADPIPEELRRFL